jgi:hypothetical protein
LGRRQRKRRARDSSQGATPPPRTPRLAALATSRFSNLRIGNLRGRTLRRFVLLALLLLVGIFLFLDRPFQGSGYEAEDIQTDEEASRIDMRSFYDSFSVGVSKATDFGDAEFIDATVEFAKSPRGGWDAKFVTALKQGAQKPGSIILVLPKRARDISPVVMFTKAAPNGPAVKTTLPFKVSQQGDDRIVRLSYIPKKMDVGKRTKQTTRQEEEEAAREAGRLTLVS